MFEGLVRQLILGYLGRYIRDIQKEQLKITLWNEEVLLENVELILEAFDYLQLPFALKHGRVGKLSIKIPWKKLGWDPIIIVLEDVFISACQREDKEWSVDEIEKREFAGKKAKLAAAELAKLSRRVCDDHAGKSFSSYITAKILDGIQVSIRNVHVLYRDMLTASAVTVFGLKFSGLTISRQNLVGLSSGKIRGGQVNKVIEVQGLESYCRTFQGTLDLMSMYGGIDSKYQENSRPEGDKHVHMLSPLNVLVYLSVNRSGKLENDAPQYNVNVVLTNPVVSLDEVQLQQILTLCDYLSTCPMREKYGRYRPWWSPLGEKRKGWQIAWWHYAQESVLSDVRKQLRRTSWKYLGERMNQRRKYIHLYKTKLKCLQQDQAIEEDVLCELEEMERLSDIDDILSYRSAAEREIKDLLATSLSSRGSNGANFDMSLEDERPSNKPRGWLNWLSRGMLGAGGTDDSSQFSGVISDDVIKDIYEATKFRPAPSMNEDAAKADEVFLSSIKFNIHQFTFTLQSVRLGRAIAHLMLDSVSTECKIWERYTGITATINAVQLFNPFNNQVILMTKINTKENELDIEPSLSIQVEVLPRSCEVSSSVKVNLQPIEVKCDTRFLMDNLEFFYIFGNFKFQQERILSSINEISNVRTRLLSKIDCILSNRKSVMWDVNLAYLLFTIPWVDRNFEEHKVVVELGDFTFKSNFKRGSLASDLQGHSHRHLSDYLISSSGDFFPLGFQLDDFYDHYQLNFSNFEVLVSIPCSTEAIPIFEKLNFSANLESCIIPDEAVLKRLDVYIHIPSILFHFSPSIYCSILGLIGNFNELHCKSECADLNNGNEVHNNSNGLGTSEVFWFSVSASLEFVNFKVDLENEVENGYVLLLCPWSLDVSFNLKEFLDCWMSMKGLQIVAYPKKNVETKYILCSSGGKLTTESSDQVEKDCKLTNQNENFDDKTASADGCLKLHFESYKGLESAYDKFSVSLSHVEIHCYPFIIGLLVGFFDRILKFGTSVVHQDSSVVDGNCSCSRPHFDFEKYGFSNFVEGGSSECMSIPLENFPFTTICNSGPIVAFETLVNYATPRWRKYLDLRVRKVQWNRCSLKEGSTCFYCHLKKPKHSADPFWQNSSSNEMFEAEFNLYSMRLYFHDSACVVGTISLATCKSSLSVCDGCFDFLCSMEGLILSSSWWPQTISGFLWGPLLPNLSPILNVRARNDPSGSIELSFGLQHVSCTLPPELLAVIIGYASSPEWSCKSEDNPITSVNSDCSDLEVSSSTFYKFEILDCDLLVPVRQDGSQFLKFDIQQLLGCFIENSDFKFVLKEIPFECLVVDDKISNRNHCLNLFGRDLSLSLMLMKDDLFDSSSFDLSPGCRNVTLISSFDADVWVRVPFQLESCNVPSSYPICVMSKIIKCQLVAGGIWTVSGFRALVDIINQFSLVDKQSKLFKYDVLEFLELKRQMEDDTVALLEDSAVTSTDIRLCMRSLSIRLCSPKSESTVSELVAEVEMQLMCSASIVEGKPYSVNVSLSYLTFFSSLNSVMLVECPSSSSSLLSPRMTLSVSDQGKSKVLVSLPCIDVWMHMSDWRQIFVLLGDYQPQTSRMSTVDALPKNYHAIENLAITVQSPTLSRSLSSENPRNEAGFSAVKLEGVGITTYIPVQVNREIFSILEEPQTQNQLPFDIILGNQHVFLAFAFQSSCSEMVSSGKNVILTVKLEKVGGMLVLCKDNIPRSWSLFEVFQVNLGSEVLNHQIEDAQVNMDIHCDSLDIWLSNDTCCLFRYMLFEIPESGPSQLMFNSIKFSAQLKKVSILLTDAKWSSCGPLVEILMRNLLFNCNITQSELNGAIEGDLQANYNNIDEVLWEPFVEPWKFQLSISRKHDYSSLLDGAMMTHAHLKSTTQLNLNLTESLIEVIYRTTDMMKDVWELPEITTRSTSPRFFKSQIKENLDTRRYAPYILQNLTSLPLVFHICEGELVEYENALPSKGGYILQAGSSVPIYVDETPKKQLFHDRLVQSSERHYSKQIVEAAHSFIIIQLEGTSIPSPPISMDLVGLRYFEADFSKPNTRSGIVDGVDNSTGCKKAQGDGRTETKSGFVIPVVVDVSVQRYSKLLRVYSTVLLKNATSVPLEVRFDIPFGVSPKILDPIYPGKEFPLPLHLAEAGRMRWRPLGDTYLWSEAYNVSNLVLNESRTNLLRSFMCYPSHPSSAPFRCCISVDNRSLPAVNGLKRSFPCEDSAKTSNKSYRKESNDLQMSKKRLMHLVILTSPLVFKNYLPVTVSVLIDNGGITRSAALSKVETSFFHIDSSNDLTITCSIERFRPSVLKFPRAETFSAMAKFSGTKFSLSETIAFDSEPLDGPLYVTMEKIMDAFSGAREICISVPFLIYNCIGFPLILSNSVNELKGNSCIVTSCYDLHEHDPTLGSKVGLSMLSSTQDLLKAPRNSHLAFSSLRNKIDKKAVDSKLYNKFSSPYGPSKLCHGCAEMPDLDASRSSLHMPKDESGTNRQLKLKPDMNSSDFEGIDCKKANPCMYSPGQISSSGEILVRLSRCLPDTVSKEIPSSLWSSPFLLVPPTGSTSVVVPQLCGNAGYLVSVSAVAAPFPGRTKIITFQPRYVISNACSRALFYKQKGTDRVFLLEAGQHSHIQCIDIAREFLVCIRFHEPGSQWSGCFSPEHLGDTQVKMWNYASGSVNMIRAEVQSADVSIEDNKVVGSAHGNSGTNLILLSDDDTGFMPYRIDNFSMERLRVYQQRCETFETMVHSYTSQPYAWDEPCFPHRLTVEVLGERIIGIYTLDDVKDYSPVYLPATLEKPERTLLVSVHSEGAIKVLSIIDSSHHVLNDLPTSDTFKFKIKQKEAQKRESFGPFNQRILVDIPFIGISLMNSYPEELLFLCAKNSRIDLTQSVDQQKFCLHISFLQIDNQLPSTPYPVILSFDKCYKGNKDDRKMITGQIDSDRLQEPVIYLSVAKWRTKNMSLVSFEHINLRVTDFHLELEQDLVLSLLRYFKTMQMRFQTRVLQQVDSTLYPSFSDPGIVKDTNAQIQALVTTSYQEDWRSSSLPPVIPIGAPWQQIHLLARKQKKIYVELLDLAPIKMTLSFSSSPWMLRSGVLALGESLIHRGFMALADVEGANIHLKELILSHQLASWESIQEILIRHYSRQSLHEMYKLFGSAGLIGNPLGFARSVSLGIKDFVSVPVQNVFQSPVGLLTGMAQGTTSLLSNTLYAISDAASQFSRAAHKGIVAFALDNQNVGQMGREKKGISTNSKGVINEFLEGLTGLLQSPVQGAEKHGLPGVVSGIALGVTGLVAKPAASILEVTGKTAQSIRNRSKIPHVGSQRFRVRLPRALSEGCALKPYSWEEAIGTAVLRNAENVVKLGDQILIMCKALRQGGKFVIVTDRSILVVSCSSLVDLGKPDFLGVPASPEWAVEADIGMDSVIHATIDECAVHIVGSSMDTFSRASPHQQQKHSQGSRVKRWNNYQSPLPLFQTNLEFACKEDAQDLLQMLLSTIEKGKDRGWGRTYILHQSNLK
nr:uncharacterized protein LOC113719357 isoform X2 [Coffea arabica]